VGLIVVFAPDDHSEWARPGTRLATP